MTVLEANEVGFGYPSFPVGRDVDLSLAPGEVLCLLGPNGCGKTTLFKTLLGLIPRHTGRITLDGTDIKRLARSEIARQIAYVPQAHTAVFPYSVRDMVLMGRTAHRGLFASPMQSDGEIADRALETLGIAHLGPRDYTRISGGQRQLALIARALAQETPLIVMDEPTASLDFGNQVLVLRQVKKLAAAGLGIILSTHNPDHVFICGTSVIAMEAGRTKASGPPVDVLTPALLSAVYGVDVRVEILSDGTRVCAPGFDSAA